MTRGKHPKARRAPAHAGVVRSEDQGKTWRVVCACKFRSAAFTLRKYAEQAAKAHDEGA